MDQLTERRKDAVRWLVQETRAGNLKEEFAITRIEHVPYSHDIRATTAIYLIPRSTSDC
jgi:hypothetical protein